jgi:IS6 family transposase
MRRRSRQVPALRSSFAGFRFPPDVITLAVRWYLRYGLLYRDVEELLAERGINVDHVTVYRWVQRFTLLLIDAAQPCRHTWGDRWFVDETYVKVAGRWVYLYRAIDQCGPGHRRPRLREPGSRSHSPVLHPGARPQLLPDRSEHRPGSRVSTSAR